jgi:hypothetical protein
VGVEVVDVVVNIFGEGWRRKGGEKVVEMGGSAVRRPSVDLLSTAKQRLT